MGQTSSPADADLVQRLRAHAEKLTKQAALIEQLQAKHKQVGDELASAREAGDRLAKEVASMSKGVADAQENVTAATELNSGPPDNKVGVPVKASDVLAGSPAKAGGREGSSTGNAGGDASATGTGGTDKNDKGAGTGDTDNDAKKAETKGELGRLSMGKYIGDWAVDWASGKAGPRVYFDVGNRDPGEVQLFKNGDLQLTLDFLSIYCHRRISEGLNLEWGPFLSVGIASSNTEASNEAAVLMWSAGVFLRPTERSWALEAGYMTGVSAHEGLDATTRDDTAFFVGISVGAIYDSNPQTKSKK